MTEWHEHLWEMERERVAAIQAERKALAREMRKIYDRARKRGNRTGTKTDSSNRIQTAPTDPQES